MNRILIAAVALCAIAYAVYAVWLKPGSNESAGNISTPSETIATSPDSTSAPMQSTAGAPPEPAPVLAPAPEKAAETVTTPPASTPKAEKAHHASHSKKPSKPPH